MDYTTIEAKVVSPRRKITICYMELDERGEARQLITVEEGTSFTWRTLASFYVFAVRLNKEWFSCRAIPDDRMPGGYNVRTDVVVTAGELPYAFYPRVSKSGFAVSVDRIL